MCVPVTSEDLFADDRAVKPGHDSVDGLLCTLGDAANLLI